MCHRSGPVELCEYFEKKLYFEISKVRQVRTCGIMWKNAGIYKMCHRSGPVELWEKLVEFIKCATGPDLWNYVKNARINKMCHRSGPVELFEKMLE